MFYKIFLLGLAIQLTQQACLEAATLKNLGFADSSIQAAQKIDAPTVCKDVFKSAGACIKEDEVKKQLEDQQEALFKATAIKTEVKEVLTDVENAVKDDQAKKDKVKAIVEKLDASHTKCFQALDLAQMGALCHVASANGD